MTESYQSRYHGDHKMRGVSISGRLASTATARARVAELPVDEAEERPIQRSRALLSVAGDPFAHASLPAHRLDDRLCRGGSAAGA